MMYCSTCGCQQPTKKFRAPGNEGEGDQIVTECDVCHEVIYTIPAAKYEQDKRKMSAPVTERRDF